MLKQRIRKPEPPAAPAGHYMNERLMNGRAEAAQFAYGAPAESTDFMANTNHECSSAITYGSFEDAYKNSHKKSNVVTCVKNVKTRNSLTEMPYIVDSQSGFSCCDLKTARLLRLTPIVTTIVPKISEVAVEKIKRCFFFTTAIVKFGEHTFEELFLVVRGNLPAALIIGQELWKKAEESMKTLKKNTVKVYDLLSKMINQAVNITLATIGKWVK
uniref:Uncharacterized protein n=1 Tax=Ditylenchus dipsaci TaxID=166011 RepID=A0A915CVX2_9BILA